MFCPTDNCRIPDLDRFIESLGLNKYEALGALIAITTLVNEHNLRKPGCL
jgi:hypothetical protein